jgi:hypothetical protein
MSSSVKRGSPGVFVGVGGSGRRVEVPVGCGTGVFVRVAESGRLVEVPVAVCRGAWVGNCAGSKGLALQPASIMAANKHDLVILFAHMVGGIIAPSIRGASQQAIICAFMSPSFAELMIMVEIRARRDASSRY